MSGQFTFSPHSMKTIFWMIWDFPVCGPDQESTLLKSPSICSCMSHGWPWRAKATEVSHLSANENWFDLRTNLNERPPPFISTLWSLRPHTALTNAAAWFIILPMPQLEPRMETICCSASLSNDEDKNEPFTFLYLWGKVNLSIVVWTAPRFTLPSLSSSCKSSCKQQDHGYVFQPFVHFILSIDNLT